MLPPSQSLGRAATITCLTLIALVIAGPDDGTGAQTAVTPGFADTVVLSGLELPTVVAFSPDGRVFVGEKSGLVKVFDSLDDPQPAVFADLRTQVHNFGDRGLLGLALDPAFPARPYVYVLYTRDANIGGTAPKWGTAGATGDPCPLPDSDGCTASGRVSRLQAAGNVWTGTERVLVDGWFQQFNSHSMGALAFDHEGALYASGGDAASWQFVDYGQEGQPPNPAGDPPVPVGGTQTPPTAEGGALRAQDLRTDGDPVGLSGTVIRINPETGSAVPDNPLYAHPDANAKRILGYGLRNPYRMAIRPGTREVWVGDVGWREHEELNVIPDAALARPLNFGWPCYDGTSRQPGYDAANLRICEDLYAEAGAVTFARYQYREGSRVVSGETCGYTDSATSGLAFYQGGSYPAEYVGALFFADFARRCIWVMPAGATGIPDPARRRTVFANASAVDLKTGPGGDLFYVDILGGSIHRIAYGSNQSPVARIVASPRSGSAPLTVMLDGTTSTDPEGGSLTYGWDLNGDGTFGDSTSPTVSRTYSVNGSYTVRLRVTDSAGLQSVATTTVVVGNTAPAVVIDTPASSLRWRAGQSYVYSGHAWDPEDGALAASRLSWQLILSHCSTATSCHEHPIAQTTGASGTFTGVDHEYPSYLTLRLTATDSGGLQQVVSRRLDPQTVAVTLDTRPSGLQVGLGSGIFRTPVTRTLIVGTRESVSAPSPQTLSGANYTFSGWSDGGGQTHLVTAPSTATTLIATFNAAGSALPTSWTTGDIGAVATTGSASHSAGTFTVRGAGADVWGTSDAFRYAYTTLRGDGTIVARVAAAEGSHAWTKVGVMIRASTAPGSPYGFMLVSTQRGLAWQWRPTAGSAALHASGGAGVAPRWVRLSRAGNSVTAFVSSDGTNWTSVGSATISLPATALVGLAVSSHTSQLATGTFDHVTVMPAPWQSRDIGAVGRAGSATAGGEVFTIAGAGADVWNTVDALHYAYRPINGDGSIVARVATMAGAQPWTKVGVMIRETLAPGSAHAFMLVSTAKGLAFQRRTETGSTSVHTTAGTGTAPRWIRLQRAGNVITAAVSADGSTWTKIGSDTFTMAGTVYAGLAVSSHDTTRLATGTFDHVVVVP